MTLRSPVLRKLLVSALLLILVALGSAGLFVTRNAAAREVRHARELLEGQARILGPALAGVERNAAGDWTDRMGRQARARVTVIDRQGVVVADSQHDSSTMDNHAGRPEVRQALAGKTGSSVRHSATLDVDLCYLAVPAALADGSGVVLRLAVPLEQIQVASAEVRWLILRASLLAGAFALAVAFFFSRAFSARIRRIENFATELVNADYSGTLAAESDDELGSVARSLRGMAEQFRKMLRRLSDESARRKAILASMVEGVLAVDSELRVTFCNDSFARAMKARSPLPDGMALVEVVRDPELLEMLKQAMSAGKPVRKRLALVAADGRIFDVQAAPLEEDPHPGAIAILHDVTELERLERVRKDFVANVSHELRTPLASIRGYVETLLDGALEDRENSRKFLEIVQHNAIRLGDMAADLLALSQLEAEREAPPAEEVSVREVVLAAIATVEGEAEARSVSIIPMEVQDIFIRGHRFRLEHALLNLLHNAVRFNRPGGDVLVEARLLEGRVRIAVTDTGIGIPHEDLPRIFERFYCVDKGRSRGTGGTGLGLAIVKHTVEKMGGVVTVESHLGKGSTFSLIFPAVEGTADRADTGAI